MILAVLLAAATPATSQACPSVSPSDDDLFKHYRALKTAPDRQSADIARNGLWKNWTRAPDAAAQEMLDSGMERIRLSDFGMAIAMLDQLIAYCPGYAEGYNQRAFAHFLRQEFDAALADLNQALAIDPDHIGALAGKGLALMNLGQDADALKSLEAAHELDPWLRERGLIMVLRHKLGIEDL